MIRLPTLLTVCLNLLPHCFCPDLSHLNNGGLVTPKEEVEETIKRRETQKIGVIMKGHATTQIKIKGLPPNEKL